MRSFAVTAVAATGLLGLAPQAQAAVSHPQPRPDAQAPQHRADPRPQPRAELEIPQHRTDVRSLPEVEVPRHRTEARPLSDVQLPRHRTGRLPQRRPSYILNMTGQATHWRVVPGELEVARWTLTNAGDRRLDHVQLVASVPDNWTVRDGQGCERRGSYLGCDVGSLEPGRSAAVVVPMIVQRPFGAVRLTAWSRASAGPLTVPGPTTSFRVFVVAHH